MPVRIILGKNVVLQNSTQLRFLNLRNDDDDNNDNDDDNDDDEEDNLRAYTGISGLRERKGKSNACDF